MPRRLAAAVSSSLIDRNYQCDRQRPCGRCTQLGLVSHYRILHSPTSALIPLTYQTGLCVYEVDNPSHRYASRLAPSGANEDTHGRLRANAQDEAGRLKKRVAELESIIREVRLIRSALRITVRSLRVCIRS